MNKPPDPLLSFLQGGGELGALIRAMDWSATPLGPPDAWPQSLKTTLGILLNSRYPMFVFWGPQLVKIYNDGYRPITGHKHPWALGRPGPEVWPEIWSDIKPLVDRALGGDPTWSDDLLLFMERNGFPEEVYFTFSYSPIPDESGGVGGMFCACTETTAEVLGERRLRTLRDLAAAPADARTVAAACELSATVLSTNPKDVPFALIYLADDGPARLMAQAGVRPGDFSAPLEIAADGNAPWPVHAVLETRLPRQVSPRQAAGGLPAGPWPEAPTSAMVLPLVDRALERGVGALVLGISSRRPFDDEYRGWFEVVARQLGASISNARAAEEERKRTEALAALDRAKTTFFSNVSHEFRTPLTLMLAPIEDQLRQARGGAGAEWLSQVHRNALRLQKLVNTLLEFSRIEAGRVHASFEPTDLARFTADVASSFRSAIESAGLRFRVELPAIAEPIHVDREMWEKVVLNLLSNAFKFTLQGEIGVEMTFDPEYVHLRVRDTGNGIPAEDLRHMFDRFHRVESARGRVHEGTGIGLALSAELIKLHGGKVAVESIEGQGSTFTVSVPRGTEHLPADQIRPGAGPASASRATSAFVEEALRWVPDDLDVPARIAPAPGPDEAADAPAPASVRPHARILIADDNADMRAYLRRLLGAQWAVTTVANGRQALAALRGTLPDLVLTDVMMPELDGFGLLAAIRRDDRLREVPVIMLSARAGEESQIEGLEAGADDYVIKPFSARELIARVETQLLRARVRGMEAAQRDRLAEVFHHAPAAIAILRGPSHVFELANPAYLALVGNRSVVGRPIREALPELRHQGIYDLLDEVYRSGAPHVGRAVRTVLEGPDGRPQEYFFDFVYQPMPGPAGHVHAIAVVAFDVTDLAQTKAAAEAASRAKDEFLAMLGHELRNPLAPIMTALQLMRLRGITAAERERVIIERQVRHLMRLVDDLLDVSRVTRGKVDLRLERVELADVVARAIETASPMLEEHRHDLLVNVPREGLQVEGDPARLAQIVSNLLTNAAKYTEPGGRVWIDGGVEGRTVVLTVRDSGVGIDRELLTRVFDLFTQGPQAVDRSRGGLGIGLALVKSLVALHGGSVMAASEGPGRGSSFTVRLPHVHQESASATAGTDTVSRDGPPPESRQRVLIVDDNVDAAEMIDVSLKALGFRTRVAHDGASALRAAAEFDPHVAVLDIGLPVMDGYELAGRIAQLPLPRKVRLIALTGYGLEHDRMRSSEAGFDAHLVKPVDIDDLERVLAEHSADELSS